MNKVYERPTLKMVMFGVQDLVTTSLGYALGEDKEWQENPWEDANGGANA